MFRTCVAFFTVAAAVTVAAQKAKPEDLVAGHVERALGSTDPAVRAREIKGSCQLTTTTMGAGSLSGPFTFASTGNTSNFVLRFENENYEGEAFHFDGQKVDVAFAQPRKSMRSAMGMFLSMNRVILRDGLLGGVLNGRWPPFEKGLREAKLSSDGVKRFEGTDFHRLRYRARRDQGDLTIYLYFDRDTFRHAGTVYEASRAQSLGFTPETSSQQPDQYFTLQERFSDFETQAGLDVPKTWTLRYARTGGSSTEWKYECKVRTVAQTQS